MSKDEMLGVLDYLHKRDSGEVRRPDVGMIDSPVEEDISENIVSFVTGNIRVYIDLEHTRSSIVDRSVALFRTKQQGYVPLDYFPRKVRGLNDEEKIKEICYKITELEKGAMKELLSTDLLASSDMGRVFTPGDIIIGDSKHASPGIYVPYVDENSIVIKEKTVDPKVKKLIKDYYIDKM